MSNQPSSSLLLVPVFLALLHNAYYAPMLPPIVASHFDGAGNPDGWMTRHACSLLYTGFVVMACTFLPTGKLTVWFPDRFMNLPNKAF
jgi:hypothetical protein